MQKIFFSALAGVLMGAGFQSLAGDHNGHTYERQEKSRAPIRQDFQKQLNQHEEAIRKANKKRVAKAQIKQQEAQLKRINSRLDRARASNSNMREIMRLRLEQDKALLSLWEIRENTVDNYRRRGYYLEDKLREADQSGDTWDYVALAAKKGNYQPAARHIMNAISDICPLPAPPRPGCLDIQCFIASPINSGASGGSTGRR